MSDSPVFGMPPIPLDDGPRTPPALPARPVGWGYRIGAYVIDYVFLTVPTFIGLWLARNSVSAMMTYVVVTALLVPAIRIELLRRFGGTPGKRLLKFHVTTTDGSSFSYRHAFLRESVTTFLAVFLQVHTYLQLDSIPLENRQDWDYFGFKGNGMPPSQFALVLAALPTLWLLVDFAVMVTNSQFRAVHDKMAGTIAIFDDKPRR